MAVLHPNTIRLLALERQAHELGWPPDKDFCYEVAKRAGELGYDFPSGEALEIAKVMVKELREELSGRKR